MNMRPPPELPDAVRELIAAGRLWRAKEILSGHVATFGYSPSLYEQYGYVLLQMQDLPEAGRFLFLSGARSPEYEAAISIFLARHGRSATALAAAFPKSARSRKLEDLPPAVAAELRARGVEQLPARDLSAPTEDAAPTTSWRERFTQLGCIVALLFAAASALAGIPVIVRFIATLFD